MPRLIIPIAALALTLYSIANQCPAGVCRFDQLYASVDAGALDITTLVDQDPSNPMVWSAYAERLAAENQTARAAAAFERAIQLGPAIPAVQMRAANFYFTHGDPRRAAQLSASVLQRTAAYDEILFSYFRPSAIPIEDWLAAAIPHTRRAARAWISWLRESGTDRELRQTWTWARTLLDQPTIANAASALWRRKMFRTAHDLWSDGQPPSQLIANAGFQNPPAGGPFDWTLTSPPSIQLTRRNGLEIRFQGADAGFYDIRQATMVTPGVYRFAAEVESDNLTSNQCPYFHLVDPARPDQIHAETPQILGTTPRHWITVDITIPPTTEAIEIILERLPSVNRIHGTLRIYQTSLRTVN